MTVSICLVPDCTRPARAKGMCGCHYQRQRTHGSTDRRERELKPWRTCTIKDCDLPSRTRRGGSCEKHYVRFRRHGSYDAPVYGSWAISQHGYVVRIDRSHPAASRSGYLYQHRMVLYDAIGPGEHGCHWCGQPIEWHATDKRKLVADHLDGNKQHNHPSNLVASCHGCNATRGLFMKWVMDHRDDPFLHDLFNKVLSRTD